MVGQHLTTKPLCKTHLGAIISGSCMGKFQIAAIRFVLSGKSFFTSPTSMQQGCRLQRVLYKAVRATRGTRIRKWAARVGTLPGSIGFGTQTFRRPGIKVQGCRLTYGWRVFTGLSAPMDLPHGFTMLPVLEYGYGLGTRKLTTTMQMR